MDRLPVYLEGLFIAYYLAPLLAIVAPVLFPQERRPPSRISGSQGAQLSPEEENFHLAIIRKGITNELVDCPTQLNCIWIFICVP